MLTSWDVDRGLTERIERGVLARTHGRVRDLHVECDGPSVVLRGRAANYYTKQLALHGAMDVTGEVAIVNAIEVG